jgi:hypothetical protein
MILNLLKKAMAICTIGIFLGCTTDDVEPALIEFSTVENDFSEANGLLVITAALNAPATNDVAVDLIISGTATQDVDYSLSSSHLVIPSGSILGSITITAIQDSIMEGIETIEISTGAAANVILLGEFNLTIRLLDDDADTDMDGVVDADDDCVDVPGDPANNGCPFLGFIINEVLYDPGAGNDGDANGDGTRDPNEDEFIEFFNSGPALDISGYRVFDDEALLNNTPRHIFPLGTVVPLNGAIVLFGGGTPTGLFGGSATLTASAGTLNLTNAGDRLIVQDAAGVTILIFEIEPLSNNPDESYTRDPDLTGSFVQHSAVALSNGRFFSPGTKLNGTSF